jgi:hypothetical protein
MVAVTRKSHCESDENVILNFKCDAKRGRIAVVKFRAKKLGGGRRDETQRPEYPESLYLPIYELEVSYCLERACA